MLPLLRSEGGVGVGGEEPFMDEKFEGEAGRENRGIEGELFEVGAGEGVGRGLAGKLGAEEVLSNGAGSREERIRSAEVEERIDEGGVVEGMDLFLGFAIDPFGDTKWGERGRFGNEGEKTVGSEDLEDLFLPKIGNRLEEKARGFFFVHECIIKKIHLAGKVFGGKVERY